MCVGITIIKWDSTCHSQTHGTEPPVHFCCSHYISSTPPFHSLSLSLAFSFSLSLFLSLSLYLCPLFLSVVARHMSSDALYQIFSSWSILLFHTISFTLFTDYLLRLPSSELLEKHLFRSRANRRLVFMMIQAALETSDWFLGVAFCDPSNDPISDDAPKPTSFSTSWVLYGLPLYRASPCNVGSWR